MQDTLDVDQLTREFVRALRGSQSQRAASKRLGYRTNVFYSWESGARSPRASEMLRFAWLRQLDLGDALGRLTRQPQAWMADAPDAAFVHRLLHLTRGQRTFASLVDDTGIARCTLSRWFNGHAEPRLPDLFALLEATTLRVVDFVVDLVGSDPVPSARTRWRELEARRHIAWSLPWSHAILRALELGAYQRLPTHLPGWLSTRLGISRAEEDRCLEALEAARLIERNGDRFRASERTVDTSAATPDARRSLKQHWHRVAEDHLVHDAEGFFSYNLFSVSAADLATLKAKHVAYFQDLRSTVAASESPDHVMLLQLQLFELGTGSV